MLISLHVRTYVGEWWRPDRESSLMSPYQTILNTIPFYRLKVTNLQTDFK